MERDLSNGDMPQHIDITTNIGIQICLMSDFFAEDGEGVYLLPLMFNAKQSGPFDG